MCFIIRRTRLQPHTYLSAFAECSSLEIGSRPTDETACVCAERLGSRGKYRISSYQQHARACPCQRPSERHGGEPRTVDGRSAVRCRGVMENESKPTMCVCVYFERDFVRDFVRECVLMMLQRAADMEQNKMHDEVYVCVDVCMCGSARARELVRSSNGFVSTPIDT